MNRGELWDYFCDWMESKGRGQETNVEHITPHWECFCCGAVAGAKMAIAEFMKSGADDAGGVFLEDKPDSPETADVANPKVRHMRVIQDLRVPENANVGKGEKKNPNRGGGTGREGGREESTVRG